MEHKFKIGDKVRIINSGRGVKKEFIGTTATIIRLGVYKNKLLVMPGYQIDKKIGNCNTDNISHLKYDYMMGETTFELVKSSAKKNRIKLKI